MYDGKKEKKRQERGKDESTRYDRSKVIGGQVRGEEKPLAPSLQT